MNQQELTEYNIGENLDNLINLDPRGYGVCRILYKNAREYTGKPLSMNAARKIVETVKKDDVVFIITGFVLLPYKKAEMDGIISSVLLARSLVKAFDAKPIIICPDECLEAVRALACVAGLHLYGNVEQVKEYPISMGVIQFTKNSLKAKEMAEKLIEQCSPKAVISIEAPGANESGEYHNSRGLNVTALEAKSDVLFEMLRQKGVLNIAIGDLGNEIGMNTIGEHIKKYVPFTSNGGCKCHCKGGIMASTKADNIITATVSDWGAYAMMAAISFLMNDEDIFHNGEMEKDALITASKSGMIDMSGWLVPSIDGMSTQMNVSLVEMMKEIVSHALKQKSQNKNWFENVIELGFFENMG